MPHSNSQAHYRFLAVIGKQLQRLHTAIMLTRYSTISTSQVIVYTAMELTPEVGVSATAAALAVYTPPYCTGK
eukprot:3718-Heterococcus_DN1.PRE.1